MAGSAPVEEGVAGGSVPGESGASGGSGGSVAGQVRPLHDPDPYSTPPYGEPGPWAPAPPVQHPGATPAQGTSVSGPPLTGAVPAGGAPFQGAPAAAAGHGTPAHGTAAYGTAAHAAQPLGTPAHGTPPPPYGGAPQVAPPQGAVPQPPHQQVAQGPVPPQPGLPQGAVPQQALPAHGAGPAPQPHMPQPHMPQPHMPQPHMPQSTHMPQPPAGSGAHWQQYDPWRAAPLQQNGAVPVSRERRRKQAKRVLVVGAALIALISGGVGGVIGAYLERNGGVSEVELPQAGKESADRTPGSVAGIAASALPSVVTLHVSGDDGQGTGTGFVLDDRGHILTNNHVVEPAGTGGKISVTFSGGETAEAEVVGRDSGYDLAVVKVSGVSGLKPLPLGNSDNVRVGDPVVAIGAPFDLANTVTSGIISAKERPITAGGEKGDGSDISYVDALQTDAPINPGNSGGPLVDSKARVIGINSAIRSADSGSDLDGGQAGSIGLGFAIPINQGKRVAEELINTGKATHPVIGVTLDMDYTGDGARVATKGNDGGSPVNRGGPGDKAGITAGDVITDVDGQRVHSGEELIVKIRAHRPGDRLELTLKRDGDEKKVTLVLGSSEGD
ncbi:trypsin-like peptidase domain-containing protein [Streptomyces sp. NPDC002896]|uniref:S1C family serine protease n=1 Tax=Streptomyces sp. NPDC002896 TaxID=3154438 RepID=UPI0033293EF6